MCVSRDSFHSRRKKLLPKSSRTRGYAHNSGWKLQAKDKRERGFDPKDRRVVMTLEDLMAALTDYGLGIRKPAYFVGGVTE